MSSVVGVLQSAWAHGAGKDVVADDGQLQLCPPSEWGRPLAELEYVIAYGAVLAAALTVALAPTRWDDWTYHNEHRPFPSPRAKQAHRVWLQLPDGVHRIDEVRATWGAIDHTAPVPGPLQPTAVARIIVGTDVTRVPAGYGALREALTLIEVGHVGDAILAAVTAHGLSASRHIARGSPAVVIELRRPSRPLPRAVERPARRCSGLDPRGLSPDPRPLPVSLFRQLIRGAPVSTVRLRQRLALHAVEDYPDSVWQLDAEDPWLTKPEPVGAELAAAFRAPRGVVDVAGFNVVWGISAPVAAAVRADAGAYAELLIDTGAAAQQLCRAAARAGLVCRPTRGVEEPEVEAAFGLPPGEDLLYLLLIGRPRVTGFTYDLAPCDRPFEHGDRHDFHHSGNRSFG